MQPRRSRLVFLLVNFTYLKGLGLNAIAKTEVVAADLMRQTLGEAGGQLDDIY